MEISKVFDVDSGLDVRSIMFDSRKACPDSIFFAMKGKINDGHVFIDKAIGNGARCIVYSDEPLEKKEGILYIRTDDVTSAYVCFCNAFYDHPFDKMNVIGITGTSGKTTVAWVLRWIISRFETCGYIGTLGYMYDEEIRDSGLSLTTPKPDELFRIGKEMYDSGCRTVVLEASSEGLLTHRLDEVRFSTALFNNLSGDHFDIHGTMEDYFKAKCILFERLKEDGKAILNIDDDYGKRLYETLDRKKVTFGIGNEADYRAENIVLKPDSSAFDLVHDGQMYHVLTNMPARFNVYNLLAVITVLNENGYDIETFLPWLEDVKLTPGRCQIIDAGQDFNVIVDFSFTADSFDKVFSFAESVTEKGKRIIAVFGAAGDRDRSRRPGTARIADERADQVILTYDDPHGEDMEEILKEMKSYFRRLDPQIILDREKAVETAIAVAEEGDTVLLLGKGSDTFFFGKDGKIPYVSDEAAARKAIASKMKKNAQKG